MLASLEYWEHPKFRDVYMEVLAKDYLPEADLWKLKIRWWHWRGWLLSDAYDIKLPDSKVKEFFKYTDK